MSSCEKLTMALEAVKKNVFLYPAQKRKSRPFFLVLSMPG